MQRVLHLYAGTRFWGADRQLSQLYAPLRAEGINITICVLYRHQPGLPEVHPLVAKVRDQGWPAEQMDVQPRFSLSAIRAIAQQVRAGRFDIVHSHDYKSNLYGGLAAWLAGVPRVASVRGYTDRTWALRLYKHVDLLTLRTFQRVMAVSEDLRQWLIRRGLSPAHVVTIHDALDQTLFVRDSATRAEIRSRLGLRDTDFLIVSVGRLSREKGHTHLLQAFQQVLREQSHARLMFVGDGPLHDQLEAQAGALGISAAVMFPGYQTDVAGFLGASDLFVLPSLREGTPNALLEAMALGKPVVATQVGGVPEIIQDGVTGRLVPPRDPETMARAIVELSRNPNQAATLGKCGQQRIADDFNLQRLAEQMSGVYHQVLTEVDSRRIACEDS